MNVSLFALGCVVGLLPDESRANLSALRALRIAQRRLRPEVRNALLVARSLRTERDRLPSAWRFVFHDPLTTDNYRIVTVPTNETHKSYDFSEEPEDVESLRKLLPVVQEKVVLDSDDILRCAAELKKASWKSWELNLHQCPDIHEPLWMLTFFEDDAGKVASKVKMKGNSGTIVEQSAQPMI
jgi:hypothetical protein